MRKQRRARKKSDHEKERCAEGQGGLRRGEKMGARETPPLCHRINVLSGCRKNLGFASSF